MGLIIIDRIKRGKPVEQNLDYISAMSAEARKWAALRVGDRDSLSHDFLNRVEDIRKLDTLGTNITQTAQAVSNFIRKENLHQIHDEKAFDLDKILKLIG